MYKTRTFLNFVLHVGEKLNQIYNNNVLIAINSKYKVPLKTLAKLASTIREFLRQINYK